MRRLECLRGGLIVSIQPPADSPLRTSAIIAAMARVSLAAGAVGLRIESAADLRAVRAVTSAPIIGLVKRSLSGYEPYITPTLAEVAEILAAGADIVAFDATARPRPGGVSRPELVAAIHAGGALAMADCATFEDAAEAVAFGCELIATTLCGHTQATRGTPLPALDLLRRFAELPAFRICEGGIGDAWLGHAAREAGADAIVVGTALTDLSANVRGFVSTLAKGPYR